MDASSGLNENLQPYLMINGLLATRLVQTTEHVNRPFNEETGLASVGKYRLSVVGNTKVETHNLCQHRMLTGNASCLNGQFAQGRSAIQAQSDYLPPANASNCECQQHEHDCITQKGQT
eukprot:3870328-Amphidinium_carterae.1